MFDQGLTFLSFWRTIHGAGSLSIPSSTSGSWGPGARGRARGLVLQNHKLGWSSVGLRELEEARATGLACGDVYLRLLTRLSLCSPGGWGVLVGSCRQLVSCIMVEVWCIVVFVNVVVVPGAAAH